MKKINFKSKKYDLVAYYSKSSRKYSFLRIYRKGKIGGVASMDIPFEDITDISMVRKFPLFGKKKVTIFACKRPHIEFTYRRFFSGLKTRRLKKVIKYVRKVNDR